MKILIATGIFPPEIGGPATYVPRIAKEFLDRDHFVSVITYSDTYVHERDVHYPFLVKRIKRVNTLWNYVRYFFSLLFLARRHDIIYAFDHMSAGIPAVFVGFLLRKPVVIRVGGDFIWERYLRLTGEGVSLRDYYERGLYKKDGFRFFLIRQVFRLAKKLIFTTQFQADIFSQYYGFPLTKVSYVLNPLPSSRGEEAPAYACRTKDIVFAGRVNAKNNVDRLLDAFLSLGNDHDFRLVIVGNGDLRASLEERAKGMSSVVFLDRVSRDELWQMMAVAYGVVFPSLTDISPNTMLDCLHVGVPFITSQEIGYDWVIEHVRSFDPRSVEDIAQALQLFMTKDGYITICRQLKNVRYQKTFADAAEKTLAIFFDIV